MDDQLSRTEPATPKRREEARRKGNVPKSRELSSVAILFGAFAVLSFCSGRLTGGLSGVFRDFFTLSPARVDSVAGVHAVLTDLMVRGGLLLLPVFGVMIACGVAADFAQVGVLFTTEPLVPDLQKIDPISGLSRLFSLSSVTEILKSILKFAIVGILAWRIIRRELPTLPALIDQSPAHVVAYMATICGTLLLQSGAVLLLLGAADYAYQRWNHERSLRMTKQEVKEEWREHEGDPMVKGRMRSLQRDMARRRIAQEVPKADVVITNPTHVAVALRYEAGGMGAPRVTAKGADLLARRIRELASEHGVPIVRRPPLARALYDSVKEGQEIPFDFYQAVAEVLAYVYGLRKKAGVT